MEQKNRVLMIGLDTTKLSGTGVTEYDSSAVRKEAEDALQSLIAEGYSAKWFFMDLTNNPLDSLTNELNNNTYDCILIGAGIRRRTETLVLFESIINVVHLNARNSKICLNSDVYDTVNSVKRILKLKFIVPN